MSISTFPSTVGSPPLPPAMPPPLFMVSRRAETGGTIRLVLVGELDLAAQHHFEADLESAQHHSDRVVLDLRALSLIDCACVGTIFAAARRARDEGAVLILLAARGAVRRVLDLIGPPPDAAVLDPGDIHEHRAEHRASVAT
jgi:anti-anti-sigma factor